MVKKKNAEKIRTFPTKTTQLCPKKAQTGQLFRMGLKDNCDGANTEAESSPEFYN